MENGRFFYQNVSDVNFINGSYALKTSSADYYSVNYAIENPFQDNSLINLEGENDSFHEQGYLIKDEFFHFGLFDLSVKVKGDLKQYYYMFESTGLSIAESFDLALSPGGVEPTNSLSHSG